MIKKAKWFIKEAGLRVQYKMTKDCIFCKVVSGEMKSKLIGENDKAIAINDINPISDVHILIISKKHIESALTVDDADSLDVVAMHKLAKELVGEKKLEAFRLAYNGGKFQHVPHLHMHLLAGGKIEWKRL